MLSRLPTKLKKICCASAATFLVVSAVEADETANLYNDKCSGCHTIGGGNLVGPDLAESAKWNDSDLTKAVKRMEDNVGALKDDEVSQLVRYIKDSKTTGSPKSTSVPGNASQSIDVSKANASESPVLSQSPSKELGSSEAGARLFTGRAAFQNGGVSCIACHQAEGRGGTLGPDLTQIADKMNEAGLVSACEHTAFKIMKPTYKDHKISRQEALDLAQYLKAIKEGQRVHNEPPVVLYGFGLAVLVVGVIAFGYRGRNKSILKKLKGS